MIKIYEMFRRVIWSKLLQLNSEQSILFHRYCKLASNRSNNLDAISQVEEMQNIWSRSIEDQHLSDCLELIDYFVGSEDLEVDTDRSVYIEEYLQEVIERLIVESGREHLLINQQQLALAEKDDLYPQEILERLIVESGGESLPAKRLHGLALAEKDDLYPQESQEIKSHDQNMETIINMIGLRIKELKNTASELVTEAVIKII
jgi:hypothetical protein